MKPNLFMAMILAVVGLLAMNAKGSDVAVSSIDAAIQKLDAADKRIGSLERSLDTAAVLFKRESDRANQAEATIQKLKTDHAAEIASERSRRTLIITNAGLVFGGIITLAGLASLVFGDQRAGLKVLGLGLAVTALAFASSYFAPQIAVGGLVVGTLGILATIGFLVADIRNKRAANIEIVDGIERAGELGASIGDKAFKSVMRAATSASTKKMIDSIRGKRK